MNLFAYGSFMEPEVQSRVFGRVCLGEADWAPGYTIESIEREGDTFARAFPKEGSRLRGLRFEVNDIELKNADRYREGDYERKVVVLESGACAWIYVRPEESAED